MNKTILTIILCLAIFGVAGLAYSYMGGNPTRVIENVEVYNEAETDMVLGAMPSPEVYSKMYFYDGLVIGGATTTITATTSAGDLLLTTAQLCDNTYIELSGAINTGAFTMTLPTASLLGGGCFMNTNGMSRSVTVFNNSGNNATVTAGTGGVLLEPDGQNVVIATGAYVTLDITLLADSTVYLAVVDEVIDAD